MWSCRSRECAVPRIEAVRSSSNRKGRRMESEIKDGRMLVNGRPLRVLHIGNIANNGYNNAKILTEFGIDNDVMCGDYYHTMGCPEWEEADFSGEDIINQFFPAWENVRLQHFRRPEWFAQGPRSSCLEYLKRRRSGTLAEHQRSWETLSSLRQQICSQQRQTVSDNLGANAELQRLWEALNSLRQEICFLKRQTASDGLGAKLIKPFNWTGRKMRGACRRFVRLFGGPSAFQQRVAELCAAFPRLFPDRQDKLTPSDFSGWFPTNDEAPYLAWCDLLRGYDVVIGYATEGIFPLLADVCPFVAYEHGTIRHIPFADDAQGRLCALTYRLASGTFVTNCDNMESARRLQLPNYCFVPHPINASSAKLDAQKTRSEWLLAKSADFLLMHPTRHHWSVERDTDGEKGNDLLIRGFAQFVKTVSPRAHAIFVDWGGAVEKSKELIRSLDIQSSVTWITLQPNARMLNLIEASDCVADQFHLGTFGGIAPKGMMLGKPTLLCFDPSQHQGCFETMPPVVNSRTVQEIFEGLTRVYRDKAYVEQLAAAGRRWFAHNHSNERVARTLISGLLRAVIQWREQRKITQKACA